MPFQDFPLPEFTKLKADIERCHRCAGYYIIKLVAIPGLPADPVEREIFLDELFQQFDDNPWPPPDKRPTDQTWDDYEVPPDWARDHVIEALVGGHNIGHMGNTIAPANAREFWTRFESLFAAPRHYYTRMGFGDPEYAFQYGAVIIDPEKAGILWVVESD